MFTIQVLRAMSKLFKDSSVISDIFVQQNLSKEFPQKFCSTRWTKNEEVTTKVLLTWDKVCIVIQHNCSLPKKLSTSK